MYFWLTLSICAFGVYIVSSYWVKVNEFYEWKFPEIKFYSLRIAIGLVGIALIWGIASNIKIDLEIKRSIEMFIDAYDVDRYRYDSVSVNLFNDEITRRIVEESQMTPRERYRARNLRANEQLSYELNQLRTGNTEVMTKWFGEKAVGVHNVYVRPLDDKLKIKDSDVVSVDEYQFELYYTDIDKRKSSESRIETEIRKEYKDMSDEQVGQMVRSYLNQADTDRAFDISATIKVKTDADGDIIVNDELRNFVKKEPINSGE